MLESNIFLYFLPNVNTDKPVLRGHLGTMTTWPYKTGDLLKEVNSYEIFYDRTRKR